MSAVATVAASPAHSTGPYRRVRRVLGDPAPLACTVAKAATEAILGGPALDGYTRWLSADAFAVLSRQRSLALRAGKALAQPVAVKRARVCRVSPVAAEVSIVVDDGTHARAVAMRLEDVAGKWLATEVIVG